MQRYNPKDIEPKWQKTWLDAEQYKAVDFDERPKYVMLTEFPYPSGAGIHIGHAREYTLGDIMARQKRMQGYNVLYPMGYDAFGLPTENYAIKNKISPQEATEVNVANFQKQLEALGLSIDWARSFRTSDPDYYKWTQWLFLQFFKNGLAYQDEIAINWCPFCKTGLANEEVVNGRHERCDTPVEKKSLRQWMLKITEYADRLIDGLQTVDYPSRIADQQINWIGRSKGAEIRFSIEQQGEKPNFVILHGYTGRADKNFIPWLKETLEAQGFKVQAPQMPNTDKPVESEQVGHVLENCTFDHNTVLIGHSLGGAVAMKVLQKLEQPIKKLVLVAPAVEPAFRPADYERPFVDTFDFTYDYQNIVDKAPERVVLSENQEAELRKPYLEYLSEKIDAPLLEATGVRKHFCGDTEPFIADVLLPKVTVFTTRPDTLFGATFLVLAPEHELVQQIVTPEHKAKVETYIKAAAAKSDIERQTTDREKTGVFTGAYATNPATNEQIPIWIADYVLTGYGTGAIMAVPAHDERDFAFAAKFDLPVISVIKNDATDSGFTRDEGVMINSGEYDGMASSEARDKIVADLVAKGVATEKINYRLRDWIFSRQHYWGEPIPIIHCPEHGAVAVPDDQLPVTLPKVDHYEPTDTGESPLSEIAEWVNTTCPTCGKPAKRETDTMPNWAGSSWYYLRYFDAHNDQAFADRKKLDYWRDVDLYLGGMEHTTLHLLYSRFWHEFFYDQGLVPTPEPYKARRGQGIILAADGTKMSKSKGNVVNPTDVIEAGYGADALRLSIAFLAPYDQTTPWSPEGVAGTHRFLQRVWTLVQEFQASAADAPADTGQAKTVYQAVHKTIKKVSRDLQDMGFNTAIAALMECVNELYKLKAQAGFADREAWHFACETLALLLAPFAPHIAEELWRQLGHDNSIHQSSWPVFDEQYLAQDSVTIAVQINGKVRGQLQVAQSADQQTVLATAQADAKILAHLSGKELLKAIYVPGKILSLVVK